MSSPARPVDNADLAKVCRRMGRRALRPARWILRALDAVIPKVADLWVFGDYDRVQFAGNPRALWDYIGRIRELRVVGLVRSRSAVNDAPAGDIVFPIASVRGLWLLYRAGVVVTGAGLGVLYDLGLQPRGRMVVNLWHGSPVKGPLADDGSSAREREVRRMLIENQTYSMTTCCSLQDRTAMSSYFQIPLQRLAITGFPRNDKILCAEHDLSAADRLELRWIRDRVGGRKLLLCAPTFREDLSSTHIEQILNAVGSLSASVTSGWLIVLRPHPLETLLPTPAELPIGVEVWDERCVANPQMLLRAADALVSDVSSTWVDYLLLDRPVVGFVPDLEAYSAARPLQWDFELVFPGPACKTEEQLRVELEAVMCSGQPDLFAKKRQFIRGFFHQHQDANASRRVLEEIRRRQGLVTLGPALETVSATSAVPSGR